MGKLNHGPASRATGKAGAWVYQLYEGMQIFREYNPNVKNPQTTKQVNNRAKFKLSSQIVAQFKEVFNARLSKLAIYTRMRRAAAVNAIYGIIDDGAPDSPNALINSVVQAINAKSVSAKMEPILQLSDDNLTLTADNGDTVIYVVCSYDAAKGDIINREVNSVTSAGTAINVAKQDNSRKIVMAVALTANNEDGRATISNITANATSWQNEIARSVAVGDIEVSNMAGYVLAPAV